jgi:integrase
MSLRKRGGIWWIDIRAPNGERIRRTTETANKALAQEFHDRVKSELWRVSKLSDKPQHLWNDAAVRWLREQSHKATAGEDVTKLRWLHAHLGGKPLAVINRALVDSITEAKLAQGVSNATTNRTLELLRAILRKCVDEWEWLERAPKIRMLKEPVRRIRFLRHEEAQRLIAVLPEQLAVMASFTLSTGLRAANVTGLQWTQVDLIRRVAWIHPDQAKARRAISVPLNTDAVLLLRQRQGTHPRYVFSYHGKRITQVSTKAWYAGLEKVGIEDFRWHDLRHTWASWHVQAGTPLFALQEMGGWSSAEMVRRYAHLAADHLAPYAEKLCRPLSVVPETAVSGVAVPETLGTIWSQSAK